MTSPTSNAPRDARRNYLLGVLNGALFQAGEGFIDGGTVIPVLLARLGTSNMLIGLASGLSDLGWLLPQFLVTPWVARFPRQLWIYRRVAIVRVAALVTVAALAWPLRHHPEALLIVFLAGYSAFCFGAGFGAVPFMEVVGKTVPAPRLGSYWAQRIFWGGSLAAGAGLVVSRVLRLEDVGLTYATLFGAAAVVSAIAYALFGRIREPAGVPDEQVAGVTPLGLLREGVGMLRRDPPFRRLLLARSALSVWFAASPFIVLFAMRGLGAGPRTAGVFLVWRVAGFVLSNLLWQAISRRFGNRVVLRDAALTIGALSFAAAAIAVASPWRMGWIGADTAVLALEWITFVGGAAQSGMLIGYGSLLLELAPSGRRQRFVGLANTFVGPTMLLPMLGGAMVDRLNAPVLFALCTVLALIGYRAAGKLPDLHAGAVTPAPVDSSVGH